MPNRYLRASFLDSEKVNEISMTAELLWLRLLVVVDDFGRCDANPRVLRPKVFPLRLEQVSEAQIASWLKECHDVGLLTLYSVKGKSYLQLFKWEQGRAKFSRYPSLQESSDNCPQLHERSDNCRQLLEDAPDSGTGTDSDSTIANAIVVASGQPETTDQAKIDMVLSNWAGVCGHLAQPLKPTGDRKKKLLGFWTRVAKWAREVESEPEEWLRSYFGLIAASDFLSGRETKWRADLWWVIGPENSLKILEGKYDNRREVAR